MDNQEKKNLEEEKAGIQLGREYHTECNQVASEEDVKESVEVVNPDDQTLDRG